MICFYSLYKRAARKVFEAEISFMWLSFLHRFLSLLFNTLLLTLAIAVHHALAGFQAARFQQSFSHFVATNL